MSGIFGYIGKEEHFTKVKNGLSSLYRRGGNGIGITLKCGDELYYTTTTTQVSEVEGCSIALGVTTGYEIDTPALNNLYSVVCDGDIENLLEIKQKSDRTLNKGKSDEIILSQLVANDTKDKIELISTMSKKIKGLPSYAFISKDEDAIFVSKGSEPLMIGISSDGTYISSELIALFDTCDKFILLNDGDMAKITQSRISIFDKKGKKAKRNAQEIPKSIYIENGYKPHDEIFYCPLMIRDSFNHLIKNNKLDFDRFKLNKHALEKTKRIILTGAGSSYYVARANAYNFELLTDIETIAFASSELMQSSGIIDKETIVIAISSRGEDRDTINAVKRAKYNDAKTIGITSNKSSYLALLCDSVIDSSCDFSKNTTSLKSFQAEYFALALLGVYLGYKEGYMTEIHMNVTLKMAQMLSGKISSAIRQIAELSTISAKIKDVQSVIFTGYTVDHALACELATKCRSISKENAFALRIDELKPFDNTLVIALISNEGYANLVAEHLQDIEQDNLIICTTEGVADLMSEYKNVVAFSDSVPLLNTITIASGLYKAFLLANGEEIEKVS